MILIVDVQYFEDTTARAAGVVLEQWSAGRAHEELTATVASIKPYVSGEFYRRELPCVMELLARVRSAVHCVVVDGHVWLGEEPGLGAHLHGATGLMVVGVAKNKHVSGGAREVLRGSSKSPLYVSAAGLPVEIACDHVRAMAGRHRLPELIKRADRLARGDA